MRVECLVRQHSRGFEEEYLMRKLEDVMFEKMILEMVC
jgi:hypothetical protein